MTRKDRDRRGGFGWDPNGVNKIEDEFVRDVARAILDEVAPGCDLDSEAMARAAIEVMREPTAAMLRAGGENALETWERMIDAAIQAPGTK